MLCFRKYSVAKNITDKGGGGGGVASSFSLEKFLSHSSENFRKGALQGVTDFGYRKTLCFRGLCHDFPSKKNCLSVPKFFVEEPFYAVFQKISGREKVFG